MNEPMWMQWIVNAGTSEGVKKAWETRKGAGVPSKEESARMIASSLADRKFKPGSKQHSDFIAAHTKKILGFKPSRWGTF